MRTIIEKLRSATCGTEYEGRLYLVGGIVRDRVMGNPAEEDVDIVLEGDAAQLAAFLYNKQLSEHPPTTYPRFGTAMLSVEGSRVEFVGARKESYDPASRKPCTEPGSLQDDILRRDFTINTLLENLHTGEVLDLTSKARQDIRDRIIRTPKDPLVTFEDDPLRMLRAVRFASRLGFVIDTETYEAIKKRSHRLDIVSAERIRGEFSKILMTENASSALEMLRETGLLMRFAPELAVTYGVRQNKYHRYDVWWHSLKTLEHIPLDQGIVMRLAALLHDLGKVPTRTVDEEGEAHFYGHEAVGSELAQGLLRRLTYSNSEAEEVGFLISMHLRVGSYRDDWSDMAMRRLIRDAGEYLDKLILLTEADRAAASSSARGADLTPFRNRLAEVKNKLDGKKIESPLNGREIMEALGMAAGPKVGEVKKYLEEQVVAGNLQPGDKSQARELLINFEI
ncbi:MAG: CCA tRNA nucleotidyltransferase [Armatimonadota bacterium]